MAKEKAKSAKAKAEDLRAKSADELKKAYRYDPDDVETRRALEKLGAPGGESAATTATTTTAP